MHSKGLMLRFRFSAVSYEWKHGRMGGTGISTQCSEGSKGSYTYNMTSTTSFSKGGSFEFNFMFGKFFGITPGGNVTWTKEIGTEESIAKEIDIPRKDGYCQIAIPVMLYKVHIWGLATRGMMYDGTRAEFLVDSGAGKIESKLFPNYYLCERKCK